MTISRIQTHEIKQEPITSNPIVFLGASRIGISTLINSLCGIKYEEAEVVATGERYLTPKEDQTEPAKTSRGYRTKTRLPQIVTHDGIAFCDTPSLRSFYSRDEDTRIAESCLSSIIKQFKVRAIAIVLSLSHDFSMTQEGTIDLLCKAFKTHSGFLEKTDAPPLLFILTSTRKEDKPFDPDIRRIQFAKRLGFAIIDLSEKILRLEKMKDKQSEDYLLATQKFNFLTLIQKNLEKTFVIRSEEGKTADKPDHKDALISHLKLIPKEQHNFISEQLSSPARSEYSKLTSQAQFFTREPEKASSPTTLVIEGSLPNSRFGL